jgi:uncharacterized protein (TIGR02453 family)
MTHLPPFPGFRPDAFQFLRGLALHNEREWFKPRKATYDDELLWPARCLVADLSRRGESAGLPLTGDPRRNVFRIYRDTRFSKNKAPYKTHVGLYVTRSGDKKDEGGLYVHVAPDGMASYDQAGPFVAGGFWSPDRDALRALRERMASQPHAFLAAKAEVEDAGLTVSGRDPLKRMPRGFEAHAQSEIADALRWRGFTITEPLTEQDLQTPAFTERALATGRAMLPLLEWGWGATADR